ncbi:hypothetical protein, partial [Flavobacterium sp.]|uniref:hypothetical protein n=1 Tax=Flavobacterium sp. TaxID=239 RepID=UPI0037538AFB
MSAQKPVPTRSDSVYKKIDAFSKDRKFFKFLHRVMFKNRETALISKKKKKKIITPIKKSYDVYDCKIIRNITIETLDPFGYSAENEKEIPTKRVERFGNSIHLKSKKWTISNLLLFKKNQELDSLLVKESERLIRNQRYVRSVVIKPIPIEGVTDSIDVSVRVLDTWSMIPTGAFSNSKANLEITERNFFGLGHEVDLNYIKSFNNSTYNTYAYESKYAIYNIKNTFINSSVSAATDLNNNTHKTVRIDRPFYSTFSRSAGGFYYDYKSFTTLLPDSNGVSDFQNLKIKTYEFWAAHSFKIFHGFTEFARTTNLIVAVGFNNVAFLEKPLETFDPVQYFNSSRSLLATVGISSQKFFQDKYLFRFGTIEDIPYGQVFSITAGAENKNNVSRAYFGGRFSYGNYFNFGYLQGNIEYGTFVNNGKSEQTTIKLEANYFTDLFPIGSWKFRQFIKPVLILGLNRLNAPQDKLNLIDINGIPGFNSSTLVGTKKLLSTFQTQSYNPRSWYGFNFSPFINFTLGFLDDGNYKFFNNKLYSQIGVGVLINNDYLVFKSFQLS